MTLARYILAEGIAKLFLEAVKDDINLKYLKEKVCDVYFNSDFIATEKLEICVIYQTPDINKKYLLDKEKTAECLKQHQEMAEEKLGKQHYRILFHTVDSGKINTYRIIVAQECPFKKSEKLNIFEKPVLVPESINDAVDRIFQEIPSHI